MSKNLYALLVGINEYQGGVRKLNGCVNDVRHMLEFLKLRTASAEFELKPLLLTAGDVQNAHEHKPTREAIIKAFRQHLRQAGKDDVALFYYSGHGSQEQAPQAFWHLEPDHLNETIVCMDSRLPGHYDLADKELALLLQEVATKNEHDQLKSGTPHIVVIMDACHSGSGTRDGDIVGVRLAPTDMRERPLDSYIVSAAHAEKLSTANPQTQKQKTADWFVGAMSRHVLLAACADDESAKELKFEETNETRGVFSYHLLETLKRSGHDFTYRQLHTRLAHQVENSVGQQSPQLEYVEPQDQHATFLAGAVQPRSAYYQVNWSEKKQSWVLSAGAIHGVQAPVGEDTTHLALFPFDPKLVTASGSPFAGRKLEEAVGMAKVTRVEASESLVALEQLQQPEDIEQTFYAVVVNTPMPPVQVAFEGEAAALETVRATLTDGNFDDDARLLIKEATDPNLASWRLRAEDSGFTIRRNVDRNPWTVPAQDAKTALRHLAHIAKWQQILLLTNKATQLPEDAVAVEIFRIEKQNGKDVEIPVSGTEVTLHYATQDGKPVLPRFKLTLRNNTAQTLYCSVLDLPETFGVFSLRLAGAPCVKLAPNGKTGDSASLTDPEGNPSIDFHIPDWLREKQADKLYETLKIIVSTEEIEPDLLGQDDLQDLKLVNKSTRSLRLPKSTLGRLMNRVQTRHAGGQNRKEAISDWTTREIRVTTLWPLDSVAVPPEGKSAEAGGVLRVQGHAGLEGKAHVRLQSASPAMRSASNLPDAPAVLRSVPEGILPFEFSTSRSVEPGANTIELLFDNAADHAKITPEAPLKFAVEQKLGADESVLLVSYDEAQGAYVPVGFGYPKEGSTEIQVQNLPAPAGRGTRDLKGALRMLAYKLIPESIAEKLGWEMSFPLLRAATVGEDGVTRYEDLGETDLRERVRAAQRILLFVHGFTGDTRSMVPSANKLHDYAKDLPPYDLLLAFDYESINTRIQDNATLLREKLATVGLGTGHGKTLDVVAHSLGTQVCRWFIEREGGSKVVSRLVMMGPPNAGTPLAVAQEWATHVITLGLNGLLAFLNPLPVVAYAVRFVSGVLAGIEKVDTTLDQLQPKTEFYTDLNQSVDPRVPYFVVIGKTQEFKAAKAKSFLSSKAVHRILSLFFADQANDMAISVKSAEAVALLKPDRQPLPDVNVIDCDHISYFDTAAGLKAMATYLKAPLVKK